MPAVTMVSRTTSQAVYDFLSLSIVW